ncbi:unnamed protein product [Effrenium voratum]|nr:unnamed protein product [Effrenium voratum]
MGHHQSKTTEVESSAFFQKEEKPPISVPRSGGDEGTSSQSSSGWHVGHRSQLKRCCRLLQSKLSEVKARADGTALQECEELVRQMEALLSNEVGARPRRVSEENMSPEVQEWLVKQWTESQRLQAQDLSPIRGSSRLRAMRTVPWSEQLGELLEKVGTLDLDVEAIANQPEVAGNVITVLFVYTMTHGDVFDQLTLDYLVDPTASDKLQDRLMKFTLAIDKAYLDMPYHNNTHAADVTMMMHWFFQSSSMSWKTPLDHLLGLAAAVIHDVGHDGVNNMFHVKAQTPVALRYNDRSVLENMHCSLAFELMKENEDLNWISLMTTDYAVAGQKATDLRQYLRRGMIEMVLATDPTKHNVQMDDLKVLVAAKTHPTATTEPTDGKQKQDILNAGASKMGKGVVISLAPLDPSDWVPRFDPMERSPLQFLAVCRHAERADDVGALVQGLPWCLMQDSQQWPYDPPLSDAGLVAAEELGQKLQRTEDSELHVVVTSPFLRCVQTAALICRQVRGTRLLIDNSLGEIYGPCIMGDQEPPRPVRPLTASSEFCSAQGVECLEVGKLLGKWPLWPETLREARRRFANRRLGFRCQRPRFTEYLKRGSAVHRNFVLVSHADCVGAALALIPAGTGRHNIEKARPRVAADRARTGRGPGADRWAPLKEPR